MARVPGRMNEPGSELDRRGRERTVGLSNFRLWVGELENVRH